MVSIWNKAKTLQGIDFYGMQPVKEVMDYLANNGYANDITVWMGQNSQRADFARTIGNIGGCWLSLLLFSVLFVVIAIIFLERIDKDKR